MNIYIENEPVEKSGIPQIKEKYQDILNYLDKHTDYVEFVREDFSEMEEEYNTVLRNIVFNYMLGYEKVSKWMGTETTEEETYQKLTVKYSSNLYDYMKKQEFFYNEKGTSVLLFNSDGQTDIAFFDKEENCLLYTTTHEKTIGLNEELKKLIFG